MSNIRLGSLKHGGYWVFTWGGLFDSRAAEEKPLLHIVNLPGQNKELDGAALCGRARFKDGAPGGAWRPTARGPVERGNADVGTGGEGVQVCPRCSDELVARYQALAHAVEIFRDEVRDHVEELPPDGEPPSRLVSYGEIASGLEYLSRFDFGHRDRDDNPELFDALELLSGIAPLPLLEPTGTAPSP